MGDRRISADGRVCASCHPDGREDGVAWVTPEGPRQTPMLAGRLGKGEARYDRATFLNALCRRKPLGELAPPALTTLHNPFAYRLPYFTYFRDANYVSVSACQSKKIAHMPHVWVVHNSIRPEEFPFAEQKEDFLLFAGSFAPHKGADIAIEVARRLGRRLVLVAKLDPTHQVFYETRIAPFVDGDQVRYAGELGEERKELFRSANCLLFPTRGEEPFGLVMIEAMACGTPVVGFDRASVPEIVSDGVTGFVVRDVSEMVAAVERVDQIDPRACREHVARHFNADVMVERYLDVYEQVRASSAANGAAS